MWSFCFSSTSIAVASNKSSPISFRTSGASSRSACPAFFQALTSPISKYMPALLGSSFRNRPGGVKLRICATKRAATCAFSNLRVRGSRYSRLYSSTRTRNVMFPGWLLMRPPRPQRTSFSLRSEMMPPWLGSTLTRGGGMDPPFARGMLLLLG